MHAAEIVVCRVGRNHVAVILEFLREHVRQPRESPDAHSEIQVLPFDVASRDMLPIKITP